MGAAEKAALLGYHVKHETRITQKTYVNKRMVYTDANGQTHERTAGTVSVDHNIINGAAPAVAGRCMRVTQQRSMTCDPMGNVRFEDKGQTGATLYWGR